MTETRLEEVAAWASDLPALSTVATRVLQLTRRSLTNVSALEQEIVRDQGLVTRILRLANSAAYGVSGTIATVNRAVVVLGFDTVRSLAVTACAESVYRGGASAFTDQMLWEHSVGAAAVSRLVAAECAYPAPEEAFIAGLVHDVGKVVMSGRLPARYEEVISSVYNGKADSFMEAERAMFGFDHAEVGFLVVQGWGLPPDIAESVRFHHDLASAVDEPHLCAVVSLANALCVKLELGPHQRPDLDLTLLPASEQLGLTGDRLDALLADASARASAELAPYAPMWPNKSKSAVA